MDAKLDRFSLPPDDEDNTSAKKPENWCGFRPEWGPQPEKEKDPAPTPTPKQ